MRIRKTLFFVCALLPLFCSAAWSGTLTLPTGQRPEWVSRDGIVMAGSWEPLSFRVRRDGGSGYTPTPEQRAAYQREHSPEMIERIKAMGVNFVMMHCYKGGGLQMERESMADAVHFAELCRGANLRVGVYNYSGAFIWETFFKEMPNANDWGLLNEDGSPKTYGKAAYRYFWNRNHPEAVDFYKQLVKFSVQEIGTDLIHLDNHTIGPGYDATSADRFRRFLREEFTPEQLQMMDVRDLAAVQPPRNDHPDGLLRRAWLEFCCRSLADAYHDMGRYARTLRKDVLMECNPAGPRHWIVPPVDHGRLLRGGEAFWDEGHRSGFRDGKLQTAIRTYKVARRMDNMAFRYVLTPLEMAESMAFNLDCLGCIAWFEYAEISNYPGRADPVDPDTAPFVRFFHQCRHLLRDAKVVADVAVLRSFPSQVFAPAEYRKLTSDVEQTLIENRGCFQIVYDHQLAELQDYRALVLAGCVAMSDEHIAQVKRYVADGGKLCIIGPLATHNEWMLPRKCAALNELPEESVVRVAADADPLAAVQKVLENKPSLLVRVRQAEKPLLGLCAEVAEQPGRRLVHLVNYQTDEPFRELSVSVRLPKGKNPVAVTLANPRREHRLTVPFTPEGEVVTFSVPTVDIYEVCVVEMK